MKKHSLFLAILTLCSFFAKAQKIELRNDVIYADGKRYASLQKYGCGALSLNCTVLVRDFYDVQAIQVKYDPTQYAGYTYTYFTFYMPGGNLEARVEDLSRKTKKLADLLLKANLFQNGKLDSVAVRKFADAHR